MQETCCMIVASLILSKFLIQLSVLETFRWAVPERHPSCKAWSSRLLTEVSILQWLREITKPAALESTVLIFLGQMVLLILETKRFCSPKPTHRFQFGQVLKNI